MLSARSTASKLPADDFDEDADNRSSSLSELGDASDESHSEATPRAVPTHHTVAADDDDDDSEADSEAETERLEVTPRKVARAGTDTSLLSDPAYARTPSKLIHSRTIDQDDESSPPTPEVLTDDTALGEAINARNPLHSLSLVAASEAASLEYAGKKRKRLSAGVAGSDASERDEGPARKRSAGKSPGVGAMSSPGVADTTEQPDVDEELDIAEEQLSQLAQEEMELEERQADVATEAVEEMATVAKHTKPRKGGRRGKRKLEDPTYAYNEPVINEAHDMEVDGDVEEEDSAVLDEEVATKRAAIDELARIERKFKLFREKLCDEQIAQCEREIEALKQPTCIHPEYLAMIKALDERRAEKMAYETRLLEYKQKNLEIITNAERHQMHSQYFQTVRDMREQLLEECNQRVVELQRGRRAFGCDETEYMARLPEKRSDRIRHQTAYNLEVSILSGVAKYVGFPAAPEIAPARASEVDEDLRAMKIQTRPVAAAPAVAPSFRSYNRTPSASEAASHFLESTPWANPRHPSHQNQLQEARYTTANTSASTAALPSTGPPRISAYQTPASQRRIVDLHAPNGSASTLDATSNPPSANALGSATATEGPHGSGNGRIFDSESPVLQMKRRPGEYHSYPLSSTGDTSTATNTNTPHARPPGMLGRDPYAEQQQQHEELAVPRWGMPSNTSRSLGGASPRMSGAGAGRSDAARVNGAGTGSVPGAGTGIGGLRGQMGVSVGSALFGR